MDKPRDISESLASIDQIIGEMKAIVDEDRENASSTPIDINKFTSSEMHLTKVLDDGDPSGNNEAFEKVKGKEIYGIMSTVNFEIVEERSVPTDTNIFGGRFTLSVKKLVRNTKYPKLDILLKDIKTPPKTLLCMIFLHCNNGQ